MKAIDEREMQKTTKQRQKGAWETEAKVDEWELTGFIVSLS